MARRSQCSSAGDNPLDPSYLPPHYREEYRLAINALIEADLEGYYGFLHEAKVVDFLSQPEIEYIRCMVQGPQPVAQLDRRYIIGDGDGSSDTYWPIQSDLDAPGLDLGWPQPHRFVGPTEITTLVNPSVPEMPSIKEQVRRMIKNAQQVIAVAMDMFTDVDIFADILNAAMRNVAVYVLLDELNADHFVAMANNCRVNLDEVKFLRVRTVSGSTYFCHTGMSFKGQMTNRFVLVDCKIVLSGNYSFTWSFEKIHRCIAHVFLGELVATFDEEFRILYAQSEPLVTESPQTYAEDYGNLPGRQNIANTRIFKREYPPTEEHAEWLACSFEDEMNVHPKMLAFRRVESIHSSTDERLPLLAQAQQFGGKHSYMDQRRLMKGPKEMGSFRRHGYTGLLSYPQMNAVNREKQHIEGLEIQSAHFPREQFFNQRTSLEPGNDAYGKLRDHKFHQVDPFPGPDFPHEMDDAELPGDYDHVQRYLHSCPDMEAAPAGNLLLPVQSTPRRHSMGQSYTCQTSPTQPNLPDRKYFFNVHHKRQDQKEGLRDWRISSYLTALQHPEQEDMAEFQRTDFCDNATYVIQERPCESEISETRKNNREFTNAPTFKGPLPLQPLNPLTLPKKSLDHPVDYQTLLTNTRPTPPTTSESSCNTEGDKLEEMQNREPKESNLICEEFFRRRPNLALQRSSRLRHSLIFNSNLEQHSSEDVRNPLSQDDGDNQLKHPPVVFNILQKKRPVTKEPFQRNSLVKSCEPSTDSALRTDSKDRPSKEEISEGDKGETTDIFLIDSEQKRSSSQRIQPQDALAQTTQCRSVALQRSASFIDMNDPECRLRYFKELAAKRKAEFALAKLSTEDKPSKESVKPNNSLSSDTVGRELALEASKTPQATTAMLPTSPQKLAVDSSQDSKTKAPGSQNLPDKHLKHKLSSDCKMTQECDSSCRAIPTSATDAEKIKLKQQLTDTFSNTVEDKIASAASSGVQLSTNPKPTSQLSPIQNVSSPELVSPQAKLPKVTDSSASSSSVNTQNVKLSQADSISSQVVTGAHVSLQPSSTDKMPTDLSPTNAVASNTSTCQHPTGTETGLSRQPVPAEGRLSKLSTTAETGYAKQTDISQHTIAKETGLSQHHSAKESDSFLHATSKETFQHRTVKDIGFSQQFTECSEPLNADPAKHPTVMGPSQHLSSVVTSPSKSDSSIYSSEPCLHFCTNLLSTSPPAQSVQMQAVLGFAGENTSSTFPISKPHASTSSSSSNIKHSNPLTAVANPPSTTNKTNTMPITGLLSLETTLPSNTSGVEFGSSQYATATGNDFISESSTTNNCLSVNMLLNTTPIDVTQKDMDSATTPSQNILYLTKQIALNTGSVTTSLPETSSNSLSLTETTPARSTLQTEKCSGHTASDLFPLPPNTVSSEVNSPNSSMPSETDLCTNVTIETISVASPIQTNTSPSTEHSPVETSSCMKMTSSPTDSTSTESVFPETGSTTNSKNKDFRTSQNNILTNISSCIFTNCSPTECSTIAQSFQKNSALGSGEIQTVAPTQYLVDTAPLNNDINPSSLVSLPLVTDILSHTSSEVCQPLNQLAAEIQTTLDITQSAAHLPHYPESKGRPDEDQNKKLTKEQTQMQEASIDSVRHMAMEVPIDLGNDKVDNIKETAAGKSAGSNNAEQSKELEPCTDAVNPQPPSAEKPTHQSSTVNVLSCSNLRDDTKVLLEQISAKNQGRASKMTGTCDGANGNTQTDKQISSHLQSRSQTRYSTASPEEREKLLKRMESMRKEKKVYSRFEAP
ncbi:protein FAM83H-like [Pygocentrus nattereri]|uniref:Scaffolding anchor of CK1 domain-containing protein n=1 Tax=Pygocentrus nattereri TaxID=42514 RepID=A0A3B4BRD1_PYGNA|nr:protein FAM83H-like [Pygocentrus nattereri]